MRDMPKQPCLLCDNQADVLVGGQTLPSRYDRGHDVHCDTCGHYFLAPTFLDWEMSLRSGPLTPKRHRLSARTKRASEPLTLIGDDAHRLKQGDPSERTVAEKLESVIRAYADRSNEVGDRIPFKPRRDYPLAACRSEREWSTLVDAAVENGHLRKDEGHPMDIPTAGDTVQVTAKGWDWLGSRPSGGGHEAFIAMAFADSQREVKEAIQHAIEQAGYTPVRMDEDHYVGGVMDRVVAQIRRSRFIVADFTLNRGGVYYEAGLATGLGIPCLHVCHKGCLDLATTNKDRLHFDVAHMATLSYTDDDLPDFRRLTSRIEAVFGRGPRPAKV
jgi:hypothetical protein